MTAQADSERGQALTTSTVNGRGTMPVSVVAPSAEGQPIRCMLEMLDDGLVTIIVRPGCSIADVHDMLSQLAACDGHFQHVTFVDEYEPTDPPCWQPGLPAGL